MTSFKRSLASKQLRSSSKWNTFSVTDQLHLPDPVDSLVEMSESVFIYSIKDTLFIHDSTNHLNCKSKRFGTDTICSISKRLNSEVIFIGTYTGYIYVFFFVFLGIEIPTALYLTLF